MRKSWIERVGMFVVFVLLSCILRIVFVSWLSDHQFTSASLGKVQNSTPNPLNSTVEKLDGVIPSEFTGLKRQGFNITGGTDPRNNESVYFNFIREFVGSTEIAEFGMLNGEMKYRIHRISDGLAKSGCISSLEDPSSRTVARFLGFGIDFLDELDFETEEARRVVDLVLVRWPQKLNDTVCHVSAVTSLPLQKYVVAVLLRYFIDCKIEEKRQMESDEAIFAGIKSRGIVCSTKGKMNVGNAEDPSESRKPASFVIRSDSKGNFMRPAAYMNIVRDVLFLNKFRDVISDLEDGRENGYSTLEELNFLLKKCKGSFNRKLSLIFDEFYGTEPRKFLRHGDRYVHSNYRLLNGLLGLDEDFEGYEPCGKNDGDISTVNHFLASLPSCVSNEASYYLLDTSKKIPMGEYLAKLLVRDAKSKVSAAAETLTRDVNSGFNIRSIGVDVPAKDYLWFVISVIYELELATMDVPNDKGTYLRRDAVDIVEGDGGSMGRRLKNLREELWLCLNESSICDRKTPDAHPSTRAILRLWGKKTDIFTGDTNLESQGEEYRKFLKCVNSHGSLEEVFGTETCTFRNKTIPLREYIALVIWRYFKECDKDGEIQMFADMRAIGDMSKDLVVEYEDGRRVGEEYFMIVRKLFNGVFYNELSKVLRETIVSGDSRVDVLRFRLNRKKRNTDIFFSKPLLVGTDRFSVKDVSEIVTTAVRRTLGSDSDFMENLVPSKDDQRLFNSILSCFPAEYRGMKCSFKQSKQFYLVDFIARVLVDYIKKNPVQNHDLMVYLMNL